MSNSIIPLFHTSSSLKQGGIFTVEKAGAAKDCGRVKGPVSLCDLAKEEGLSKLSVVGANFADFMMGYKNLAKVGCDMSFGLKLVICDDIVDKTEDSFRNESKVIVFMRTDKAYKALINIYTKAATDGFYYIPRLDWKTLKYLWHEDLILALPFYSSFIARNTMTFATIMPDLPCKPELLIEVGQEMPFDDILEDAIKKFSASVSITPQLCKSIYYKNRVDAKNFLVWRLILDRKTWDMPNQEHMCSREFCYEGYKEIVIKG